MTRDINALNGQMATVRFYQMSDEWKKSTTYEGGLIEKGKLLSSGVVQSNAWDKDCVIVSLEFAGGRRVLLWPYANGGDAPGHLNLFDPETGIHAELPPSDFPPFRE